MEHSVQTTGAISERRRAVKDSLARGEVQGQAMTTVLPSAMRRGWLKASYRSPFKQDE